MALRLTRESASGRLICRSSPAGYPGRGHACRTVAIERTSAAAEVLFVVAQSFFAGIVLGGSFSGDFLDIERSMIGKPASRCGLEGREKEQWNSASRSFGK